MKLWQAGVQWSGSLFEFWRRVKCGQQGKVKCEQQGKVKCGQGKAKETWRAVCGRLLSGWGAPTVTSVTLILYFEGDTLARYKNPFEMLRRLLLTQFSEPQNFYAGKTVCPTTEFSVTGVTKCYWLSWTCWLAWGGMGGCWEGLGCRLSYNSVLRVIQPHCHSGLPSFSDQNIWQQNINRFLFALLYIMIGKGSLCSPPWHFPLQKFFTMTVFLMCKNSKFWYSCRGQQ